MSKEIYEVDNLKRKKIIAMLEKDKAFRIAYFKDRIYSFGLYYFPQFFTVKSSIYHKQVCKDLISENNLFLVAFREFWKSLRILVFLIHGIVYKRFNFCLFFSYEIKLSSSRLFDLIVQLKTNQRIKNDFGEMFPDNTTKEDDWLQKKSVSEFITSNWIKFKAMSIWMTARWLLYSNKSWSFRPDLIIWDDLDVLESVRNPELVNKNIEFIENEVFGWIDSQAKVIFLWNIITNIWIVPYFENKIKNNNKRTLQKIPIIKDWSLIWDRYVMTDKEMIEYKEQWIKKISIESKKQEQGESFWPNYLLIPSIKLWNPVFNIEIVRNLINIEYKIDTRYKELRLYKPPCECVYWIDTAWWWWWDYSTITIRDYNYNLIWSLQAQLQPDELWKAVEYIFKLWYKWKLIVENNSIWLATINYLKESICKSYLYYEKDIDKITQKPKMKYWFNTNTKTKALIIQKMEELIRTNILKEFDEREKQEIETYYYDESWSMNALSNYHDDLIMSDALAIFWIQQWKQIVFI